MFKEDLLKGKRILVTGGGTGLGKEMATHYGQHGADLYICGRRENVLKDTATEIEDKYDVKVNYETLDIRASSDVESYIDGIFQEGPIDGLVNNAAGNFISPTKDLSHKGFDAIANIASEVNATVENIGARRLHTIIEKILDEISFTATDRSGEKIIINDILGKEIFKGIGVEEINLSTFEKGVYFLTLSKDNQTKTFKILKK